MNHSEQNDTHLARTLKALADEESAAETPARVEAAVMARWDAAHERVRGGEGAKVRGREGARGRRRASRFVHGAATAAGVTLVGALAWQHHAGESRGAVETLPGSEVAVQAPATSRYTTVAVVGEPLRANEPVRVVRMRVARSVLSELGLSSTEQGDTVDIDVMVGEDGVARGVRVPM